jgi:PHP family Zn ribbon phosphoesterase
MVADLHIHTQLSPCASLDMSPDRIVATALAKGVGTIGITDHNSTLQCQLVRELGREAGLEVIMGAEVTTKEEVHCLVFLPDIEELQIFQAFLEYHLPSIPNDPARFGYQVVVDRNNNIVYEEQKLLISALDVTLDTLIATIHTLGGLAIPAHVDRRRYGLIGHLGFVPADLDADALEFSSALDEKTFLSHYPSLVKFPLISSSDAHEPARIGFRTTRFDSWKTDFFFLKKYFSEWRVKENLSTKL